MGYTPELFRGRRLHKLLYTSHKEKTNVLPYKINPTAWVQNEEYSETRNYINDISWVKASPTPLANDSSQNCVTFIVAQANIRTILGLQQGSCANFIARIRVVPSISGLLESLGIC